MLLPGRVPGYSRSDIKLLPSSDTKRGIWMGYKQAMTESGERIAAYRTFCLRWQELLPSLVMMKPLSDLCWTCQQKKSTALKRASVSELEMSSALQEYQDHLSTVTTERSFYTSTLKECKDSVTDYFSVNGTLSPPQLHSRTSPNSVPIKAHYSFDYAQQVHIHRNRTYM